MFLIDGEDEAIDYYASIREMSREEYDQYVNTISDNSGYDPADIDIMLQHLCFEEYELEDGRRERFDEDPLIMHSLRRLHNNTYHPCDLVLIDHENMEYDLVHNEGMTAADAHRETIKKFDYNEALEQARNDGVDLFES